MFSFSEFQVLSAWNPIMEKAKDCLEGCPPNMEVADWIFESLNRHDRKAIVYVQPGIGKDNRDENKDVKENKEE
ncbi:hypothetical protein L5515_019286 [Caenorhabditis briggsae]|uniref:Uncharacterized protein n=1 Tax=Caenorhabditis briggsae TaxID=6238 RepID=A0AAE9FHX7_CAEBR|nr:hypothetical protein L5515_019286 [Caenorhabditis briggsae]